MLIDSHCHLNMIDTQALGSDLDTLVREATEAGVEHMLCVGCGLHRDAAAILKIIEGYDNISGSVGLHPDEQIAQEPTLADLLALADHPKIIALGETGLDYYRLGDQSPSPAIQQARFAMHIEASKITKKPLIIHTRKAKADTIALMRSEQANDAGGVMHCFTEDWEMASKALDLGFYISFSGILTFKNALDLQEVAKKVPLDRLLIETDAPYLAPVPYRGKINQPAYVKEVAHCLAKLRDTSFETIANHTRDNFYQLFQFPHPLA